MLKLLIGKPGKGLFRDDQGTFNWLLEPLSETDCCLFTQFKQQRESSTDTLKTLL